MKRMERKMAMKEHHPVFFAPVYQNITQYFLQKFDKLSQKAIKQELAGPLNIP